MRVVLDTSALISAVRSSTGAAAEIIRMAVDGKLMLLLDYKLACEYRDVSSRTEHVMASGLAKEDVQALIELVESIATPVLVFTKYRPLSEDPNDDMVLDIAINGRADGIVTNNVKHFRKAAQSFGIQVFTPKEFHISFKGGKFPHAR